MSLLSLAAYAAEHGAHLVVEPRDRVYVAYARRFDEEGYLASLEAAGVGWLARSSLPPLLRAIHDPPPGLFLHGDPDLLTRPIVAVVGARACSPYGAQVARMLGRELAAAGLVVASGLARGIDGEAHRGALESGTTVAVLGCGIDRDYPASNAEVARRIRARGLHSLFSENSSAFPEPSPLACVIRRPLPFNSGCSLHRH